MNDEQINIAIAEALGWKEVKGFSMDREAYGSRGYPEWYRGAGVYTPKGELAYFSGRYGDTFTGLSWLDCLNRGLIPNYAGDLNAMHEAENTLTPQQKELFAKILSCSSISNVDGSTNYDEVFDAIHATARQRAIAFLKTLNMYPHP